MDEITLADIGQALRKAENILLSCHVRPDGDAIGSLLGAGLALQAAGKKVQLISPDGVPASLRHLPGSERIQQKARTTADLSVVLDCSDLNRVGGGLNGSGQPDINIDHHITNLNFARMNLVIPQAVATSEILANHLPGWGFPLPPEAAAALVTGIITDTLGFRTANMTPKTMRTVADLMEDDIDMPDLYARAMLQRSYEATCMWGVGLSNLQREGGMVWTSLAMADRRAVGYPGRDDADLINILSSINDAEVSIIFVEQPNSSIKVSWRSVPGINVSQVALLFGGGGHPAAAGAEIPGQLEDIQDKVLQETRKLLIIKAASTQPN